MKIRFILSVILLCVLFAVGCNKRTEIKGDVFVVTQGAGSYKLGLVQVAAFPEEKIKENIERKKPEIVTLTSKLNEAFSKSSEYTTAYLDNMDARDSGMKSKFEADSSSVRAINSLKEFWNIQEEIESAVSDKFVQSLPPAVAVSTTDADGKFALSLPKNGKYVLTAKATRTLGDEIENYTWAIYFNAEGTPKNIILSNNNTTDSNSPDSVFTTPKAVKRKVSDRE